MCARRTRAVTPPPAAPRGTVDMMDAAAVVLAHQGGWDEILLVAGPLVLLWGLLVLANRRARQNAEADRPES